MANENNTTKPYIVKNADGVEYLLPYYPATFRALLDDKDTIRDLLNSILELDRDHEIVDLSYAFEKYIDVFMPGDEPMRLDVFATLVLHALFGPYATLQRVSNDTWQA